MVDTRNLNEEQEFSDADFRIVAKADQSKKLAFDISGVTTATTRTITIPDHDVPLADFVGDSGSGGTRGLVPAPASGDAAANKFLKASGGWSTLPATGLTLGADTATTGATSISWTSLPNTIQQITFTWRNGGTATAAASVAIRLGDATTGGFVTTGYTGQTNFASSPYGGTGTGSSTALSDRFLIKTAVSQNTNGSYQVTATITLMNSSSHIYQFDSVLNSNGSTSQSGGVTTTTGYVTLAGALDRIEILTSSGNLNSGSANIAYQ